MPRLMVLEPGFASLQGPELFGAQRYGVRPGGAMDRLALAEANALLGLPLGSVAIEIGILPLRLKISGGAIRFAISGAERDIFVDGVQVPLGETAVARDGQIVLVRGARKGRFSYLGVQGGVAWHERSTGSNAQLRRAEPGQRQQLEAGTLLDSSPAAPWPSEQRLRPRPLTRSTIRVVLGPQQEQFSNEQLARFLTTSWSVSHASDRMAYALEGGCVRPERAGTNISDGMATGCIQIPGSGQPLVNLYDRGTTGGYPKIATIISADLGRFSQLMVGAPVRFDPVSVQEAQVVARNFAADIAAVQARVSMVRTALLSLDALLDCNVAGDAIDAGEYTRPLAALATQPTAGLG